MTPKITIGRDGGMIGPMVEDAAVTPTARWSLYPRSRIALTSIVPSPPASATAAPDMPAKMTDAITLTCPSPPFSQPTAAVAKSKIRLVIPAEFIRLPARMKKGTAINGKLSTPPTIRWRTTKSGRFPMKCV